MADKKMNLEFYAKVKADVSDMEAQMKKLKAKLANFEIPAQSSKGFNKVFKDFEDQLNAFKALSSAEINSVQDVDKISKAWDKVTLTLKKAGIQIESLKDSSLSIFSKEAANNISNITSKIEAFSKKLKEVEKTSPIASKLEERDAKQTELRTRQDRRKKTRITQLNQQDELEDLKRQFAPNKQAYEKELYKQSRMAATKQKLAEKRKPLDEEIQRLKDAKVLNSSGKLNKSKSEGITKEIDDLKRSLKKIGLEDFEDLQATLAKAKKSLSGQKGVVTKLDKKLGATSSSEEKSKIQKSKEGSLEKQAQLQQEISLLDQLIAKNQEVAKAEEVVRKSNRLKKHESQLDDLTKSSQSKNSGNVTLVGQIAEKEKSLAKTTSGLADLTAKINQAEKELKELDSEIASMKTDEAEAEWTALAEEIKKVTGLDISAFKGDVQKATDVLDSYKADNLKKVPDIIDEIASSLEETSGPAKKVKEELDKTGDTANSLKKASDEAERLKSSILEFFSIGNAIQLFKRAVRDAFDTVKELDKAMTETAVVTDFSVGDMWKKLPEYTALANDLGTTTLGAYETMTLFYQQGLKTDEAFGVGTEAMKMARIAGLDYANATNLMTAALRGFNMEVNENSAQRINDVYSELAAITAADTQEIATAMTKTASIAHNAGMDFETTSAFLTQIIETTRESAETAGTAMKTVIARFQEMRKAPSEIGEIDGEIVDANKIEAALRSVGVALRDGVTGQFRDLDDVFLELAGKWDSLDTNTQRYIATIAAGSRQQSRFLAMMSDYERTMELVGAANESAGASQRQFEKTLDSLESKLNKFKNAWNEFTMGLTNSSMIKGGVDLLTNIIQKVNALTTSSNNLLTSILKISAAIIAFRSGRSIFNAFDSGIKKVITSSDGEKIGLVKGFGKLLEDLSLISSKNGKFSKKSLFLEGIKESAKGAWDSLKTLGVGFGKFIISPAGIATAAIVGLTIALVALSKSIEKVSAKNQLKETSERIQNLKGQLEESKGTIKDIADERNELENFSAEIDNLVEGTQAWKEALVKVNDQVLSLVDKYPILGQSLDKTNGMLSIKDSGWDALISQQQQIALTLQNQGLAEEIKLGQIQKDFDFEQVMIDAFSKASTTNNLAYEGDKKFRQLDLNTQKWLVGKGIISQDFLDDTYRQLSGGLTKDQFYELAEKAYLGGHYTTDEETGKIIFSSKDQSWIEDAWKAMSPEGSHVLSWSFLNNLSDYSNEFISSGRNSYENKVEEKEKSRQFVSNSVASTDAEEKTGLTSDNLTNLLASTKYLNLKDEIDNQASQIVETGNDLRRKYKETTGKGFLSGDELYLDENFTQKMNIDEEGMRQAIASANITKQIQDEVEIDIMPVLETKTDSQIEAMNKLLSQEGTLVSSDIVDKYASEGITAGEYDELAIQSGFTNIDDMADALGIELRDLMNLLSDNIEKAQKRISKERQSLSKRMAKNSKNENKDAIDRALDLSKLEQKFGEEFRGVLNSIYDQVESAGDQTLTTAVNEAFLESSLTGSAEDVKELEAFVKDIDFTNPLESVKKLEAGIESSNIEIRKFSKEVLNSGASILTMSSRVQTFLKSADFTKLQEEINDVIKANGKLDASNILEMAEGCEELEQILEQTGATTEGLAELFNRLQDGELTINQITDAVLASLAGFESLDSLIAETLKSLSDFDPGVDENEIAGFINDAYETLNSNMEKGAYGNNQNFKYLDFLLGPDWQKGISLDQLDEQMKFLTDKLGQNKENMMASWQELASGTTFLGGKVDQNALGSLKIQDLGDRIDFTGFNGMTSQEIVDRLREAYQVSEEYAKMMLADFKNYSTDLAVELNANDYEAALESAYKVVSEKGFADESELSTIDKLYGQKVGTTLKKIRDMAKKDPNLKDGIDFTDFFNTDGLYKSIEDIYDNLSELKNQDWGDYFTVGEGKQRFFSYKAALAELEKFGFDSQQQIELIQQSIQKQFDAGAKEIQIGYQTIAGEAQIVLTKDGPSLAEAMKIADAEAEARVTAEAIGKVFEAGLKMDLDASESIQKIKEEIDAVNDEPIVLTLEPDHKDLDAAATKWDGHVSTIHLKYEEDEDTEHHARGIKNSPNDHLALVGDGNGPELVQTENGAYLAGKSGPEMAVIHKGDTVYTAEETKKIFRQKNHQMVPRFAEGYHGATSGANGGGSGGGKGDGGSDFKTSLDMLYNLLRQIQEEERERNRIERRYQQELKKIGTSTAQLVKISTEELKQLDFEKQIQDQLYKRRGAELDAYLAKNSQFKEYGDVTTNEYGERVIRIDWEKIDAIDDQDKQKEVEEYVKQLEEWVDEMADVEDTINDINDQIEEIKERGKDQYLDLEKRIKDGLIKERQDEIDQLTAINNSITEGNSKIVSAMQDSIAKQRQDRENEKTEQSLQEKYRQAAYLSQDTSNANDLELLELQKQIAEEEEEYTNNLIDQKITQLQEQNEHASQQRQQQIDILTTQLQHYEKTGQVWEDVHRILESSLDDENSLIHGSALEELLKNSDNWMGMSELERVDWLENLENQVSEGMAFIEMSNKKQNDLIENIKQIVSTPSGSGATNHHTPGGGGSGGGGGGGGGGTYNPPSPKPTPSVPNKPVELDHRYVVSNSLNKLSVTVMAKNPTLAIMKALKIKPSLAFQGAYSVKAYKKGGLADFTGPAWLDGTKSKPEVILNARDSENFIMLRDILQSFRDGNKVQTSQNGGDSNYDIDINVESIGNDYDVDRLASKVEGLINQKARYRNNNTIGIMR